MNTNKKWYDTIKNQIHSGHSQCPGTLPESSFTQEQWYHLVHLSQLTITESNWDGILQRQKTCIFRTPLEDRSNGFVLVGNGVNAPSSKHLSKCPLILLCSKEMLSGFRPTHNSRAYAIEKSPQSLVPCCCCTECLCTFKKEWLDGIEYIFATCNTVSILIPVVLLLSIIVIFSSPSQETHIQWAFPNRTNAHYIIYTRQTKPQTKDR